MRFSLEGEHFGATALIETKLPFFHLEHETLHCLAAAVNAENLNALARDEMLRGAGRSSCGGWFCSVLWEANMASLSAGAKTLLPHQQSQKERISGSTVHRRPLNTYTYLYIPADSVSHTFVASHTHTYGHTSFDAAPRTTTHQKPRTHAQHLRT